MAKQFLQRPNVRPSFQKMSGKCVAKSVRCNPQVIHHSLSRPSESSAVHIRVNMVTALNPALRIH
jgi:hypothetical protein